MKTCSKKNVGGTERFLSVAGAALLGYLALRKRNPLAKALLASSGMALVKRGLTGRCEAYAALTKCHKPSDWHVIRRSRRIHASAAEAYALCSNPMELGRIVPGMKSIEAMDSARWIWTPKGATPKPWITQCVEDKPSRMFAWESVDGEGFQNAATFRFEPCAGNGCEFTLNLAFKSRYTKHPVPAAIAEFFVAQKVDRFLKRLRRELESRARISNPFGEMSPVTSGVANMI